MMQIQVINNRQLLEWYIEAGVDEAVDETATDYFALGAAAPVASLVSAAPEEAPRPAAKPAAAPQLHHTPSAALAAARALADKADSLEALKAAVEGFDGCILKKTAGKTVFSDGNPQGRVMIIGEAPGAEEDKQGIPFCGPSGALLDKMLAAIGLDRTGVYISNTVFWRPPGNRTPSAEETAICLPFVEKHIALIKPGLLVLAGGTACASLLQKEQSISRLRGKLYDYANPYLDQPVPTLVMYHPSYFLRTPAQKRLGWADLLMVQEFLQKILNN